jgi:hypothetical protein
MDMRLEIDRQISDHDGIYVTFKCGFSNQKTFQRTIWDYKRGDYTLMRNKIIDTKFVYQFLLYLNR